MSTSLDRRQRRNLLYARALKVGLLLSLGVHAAVLALGRFTGPARPGPAELTAVDIVDREVEPERPSPPERDALSEANGELIAWRPAAVLIPTPAQVPASADFSEASTVARTSAARPIPPLVPGPRIVAIMTEQGFAPVTVGVPTWMLADGRAGATRSGGGKGLGVGIIKVGGGTGCKPTPPGRR